MSLVDDLKKIQIKQPSCLVGKILVELDESDRIALENVLQDRSITSSKIVHVLNKYGYELSSRTVDRHRNKNTDRSRCACP